MLAISRSKEKTFKGFGIMERVDFWRVGEDRLSGGRSLWFKPFYLFKDFVVNRKSRVGAFFRKELAGKSDREGAPLVQGASCTDGSRKNR